MARTPFFETDDGSGDGSSPGPDPGGADAGSFPRRREGPLAEGPGRTSRIHTIPISYLIAASAGRLSSTAVCRNGGFEKPGGKFDEPVKVRPRPLAVLRGNFGCWGALIRRCDLNSEAGQGAKVDRP
ncbi:MAG: hypothetical protein CBC48_20495 [bacterium TMED88]|nr:hypothetical protein [Deltaproteobacteria bacterium]OUV21417.1 MAG: hypothetical protein CBC48_20495 [bacterium TMED88]